MSQQSNGNAVQANGGVQSQLPSAPSLTAWNSFVDFVWFIVASIGYILQDIYYLTFGYPEKDLSGDVALITGGGSGLGRLLAQILGKMGTKIIIWDINEEGINETVGIVKALGGDCKGYVVDISKKEQVYKAADVVRQDVGDVTLLINNAGVVSGHLLLDTPDYLIERSFNVNVMAHFWTAKAFLPKMIENDRGHIVTIASLAGHVGITKLVDYCASKFAVVGFDEALRLELDVLGHKNIDTTCICPFFIQATGMFDDVNARWVPTLNPNDVADRVIKAIKTKEKVAIIPGYIKILLSIKWTFPWGCNAGLLRRLVPDAAPHGSCAAPKPTIINPKVESSDLKMNNFTDLSGKMANTASIIIHRTPSLETHIYVAIAVAALIFGMPIMPISLMKTNCQSDLKPLIISSDLFRRRNYEEFKP